jgi:hypothetical protein
MSEVQIIGSLLALTKLSPNPPRGPGKAPGIGAVAGYIGESPCVLGCVSIQLSWEQYWGCGSEQNHANGLSSYPTYSSKDRGYNRPFRRSI